MTRRTVLAVGGATLAAGFVSTAHAQNKRVRMGYNVDFHSASLPMIADSLGLWKKNGVDIELLKFTNGPLQVQALEAGSLEFGYIGPGALWLPMAGRSKIIALNALSFSDRIIAQPPLKSLSALKGKKVGVPSGSTGEMILRLALESEGMALTDVNVLAMDPSTIVAAFSSGQIDAAGIWYPLAGTIKKAVPELNELAKDADFASKVSFPSAFVTRDVIIQKDSEMVAKVVGVLKEAQDFRANNVQRAVEITGERLGIAPETLKLEATGLLTSKELEKLTKDGTVEKWLNVLEAMFRSFGHSEKFLPVSDYYKRQFYAE
ncbi:aliphatic sulfonate ABC transporter substrate-binding protein [Bradyrhizobium sp. WSM3983]|uniref:aliphatic sulfonate ABC transporter substrate-binding protein n=1 Tax=Bradyrhizobium sp. WSM3983 TaxID=1038867 RepID=UPI0004853E1F